MLILKENYTMRLIVLFCLFVLSGYSAAGSVSITYTDGVRADNSCTSDYYMFGDYENKYRIGVTCDNTPPAIHITDTNTELLVNGVELVCDMEYFNGIYGNFSLSVDCREDVIFKSGLD